MKNRVKIFNIVGARPNFIKIAPLLRAARKYPHLTMRLIHTGQHYDDNMSRLFFKDLALPEPDFHLGVGSGTPGKQIGRIMIRLEKVALKEKPDLMVVVGDVNSTLAGALMAAKLHIPLAHIEAGLRSFDRTMPEEVNRVLTDALSDFLFVPDTSARDNLLKEGIARNKIFLVGNIMIDTLKSHLSRAKKSRIIQRLGLVPKQYAVLTMHRPSNVDNKETLRRLIKAFIQLGRYIRLVFPAHPRTSRQIRRFGFHKYFQATSNIFFIEAVGYLDALKLYQEASFVLTDSGGVQEETTALGIPCLTLRDTTEWQSTIREGTNTLVGTSPERLIKHALKIISGQTKKGKVPRYWDGKTAERILMVLNRSAVIRKR